MNPVVIESIDPLCLAYGPKDDRQPHYAPTYRDSSIPPLMEGFCPQCRRRHPYAVWNAKAFEQSRKNRPTLKLRHLLTVFVLGQGFAIGILLYAAHAFASK